MTRKRHLKLHPEFVKHMAYYRQLGIFNPRLHSPRIVVVGAGGIGSWTVLQLAKLGVKDFVVYDADRVEVHNLSTTPYTETEVGERKVRALGRLAKQFGISVKYKPVSQFVTKTTTFPKADVVISGVDGTHDGEMWTRERILKLAVKSRIPLFIDGRIGGENLRVYCVNTKNPEEVRGYPATLPEKGKEAELSCIAQGVIDVGWFVASYIARAVRKFTVEGSYVPETIMKLDPLSTMFSDQIQVLCSRCQKATIQADTKKQWHAMKHPKLGK